MKKEQDELNERNLPVVIEKSQREYSEEGFMAKLSKVWRKAGLKVVYATLQLYYALNSPSISTKDKSIIYGALGYFILPTDFILDFIPFAGYSDDYIALAWAISKVLKNITPEVKEQARKRLEKYYSSQKG